jgi:hypothetical protein
LHVKTWGIFRRRRALPYEFVSCFTQVIYGQQEVKTA